MATASARSVVRTLTRVLSGSASLKSTVMSAALVEPSRSTKPSEAFGYSPVSRSMASVMAACTMRPSQRCSMELRILPHRASVLNGLSA